MINKKYLKLLRAKNRRFGENFIYNEISKNIIDSLDILKIPFDTILQLGINDNLVTNYLKEKFASCSIILLKETFKISRESIIFLLI